MSARGRPFRFLAAIGAGWIGVRVLLLWQQTGSLPAAIERLAPARPAAPAAPIPGPVLPVRVTASRAAPLRIPRHSLAAGAPTPAFRPAIPSLVIPAQDEMVAPPPGPHSFALPHSSAPGASAPLPDRWSASGWFVARAGSGIGAAPGGQLGGGQAGIRIAYPLAPRARVTAFARVAAPLAGKGREAAIGVEWQPGSAPFRVVAEQRFGLDGTHGGTGLGAVAGLDTSVRGFHLEAYGQAGAIARRRVEPYADGATRITRQVAPRFSLGAGAWGAAQRDARRLDIGPTAMLALDSARISLDWRQRIAGRARPGSGLALTLGADF